MPYTNDARFMRRALELAEQGIGFTSPNPAVGAVLVRDGRIIGEGYHARCGEAHAEIMAIRNATGPIAGATMYCTLEPCCHSTAEKHTPPCTGRLIRENIARIVIAIQDPNPHVYGQGIKQLSEAGIQVEIGLLQEEALILNEAYFKYIQTSLPFVHLKMAISLDGRIAATGGDARWISNAAARTMVHQMRHTHDAVLIGSNTARTDNPELTVRHVPGRNPLRVILDSRLESPLSLTLFQDEWREHTMVFTGPQHSKHQKELLEQSGVQVIVCRIESGGGVVLKDVLMELGRRQILSVLVEGGSRIFTTFIRQEVFDKASVFLAPLFIGEGINVIGDLSTTRISEAMRLENVRHLVIDDQILIQGYRNMPQTFGRLLRERACLQESLKK